MTKTTIYFFVTSICTILLYLCETNLVNAQEFPGQVEDSVTVGIHPLLRYRQGTTVTLSRSESGNWVSKKGNFDSTKTGKQISFVLTYDDTVVYYGIRPVIGAVYDSLFPIRAICKKPYDSTFVDSLTIAKPNIARHETRPWEASYKWRGEIFIDTLHYVEFVARNTGYVNVFIDPHDSLKCPKYEYFKTIVVDCDSVRNEKDIGPPRLQRTVGYKEPVLLTASDGVKFEWKHSNIVFGDTNRSVQVDIVDDTTFSCLVTDNLGCKFVDRFFLELRRPEYIPMYVPNVITPNGDGFNDRLIIGDMYEFTKVYVYDENGKIVFQSDNYQQDWYGEYNGKPLPQGTYWLHIIPPLGEPYKDWLFIKY